MTDHEDIDPVTAVLCANTALCHLYSFVTDALDRFRDSASALEDNLRLLGAPDQLINLVSDLQYEEARARRALRACEEAGLAYHDEAIRELRSKLANGC